MHDQTKPSTPLTYTRTFQVRHYECDSYGHLNNIHYLHYMQEAAFDASAAVGYDFQRYKRMGQKWLIRTTEIEYLQPLSYGDTVEVKTWVDDVRRVRSTRSYEFYQAGSPGLVARAWSDWVFIDELTGQPARIPAELAGAFFAGDLPERFLPRQTFPLPPDPPEAAFKMNRRVAWQDIDMEGHVNNAVYLSYVEDCGFQVIAAHGWPVQRMTAQGFAIILRKHQIEYIQPALLDEELLLTTWASHVKRSSALRYYTIQRAGDNALLARISTLGVWIDLSTSKPIRIPPDFLADFADNIV
jgi:acyl-CoA thioester hydrolase